MKAENRPKYIEYLHKLFKLKYNPMDLFELRSVMDERTSIRTEFRIKSKITNKAAEQINLTFKRNISGKDTIVYGNGAWISSLNDKNNYLDTVLPFYYSLIISRKCNDITPSGDNQ